MLPRLSATLLRKAGSYIRTLYHTVRPDVVETLHLRPSIEYSRQPRRTAYRDEVDRLNRGGVDAVGKEHFTSLYTPARQRAFTKRNVTAAWAATGLFPFNPQRVLKDTPKPPAQLTIPKASEATVDATHHHVPHTPVTPVTPVTTEALTSLHNLIKQDANGLDEMSKQRLQRRVQKLTRAARVSFAECFLLQDHNRFLSKINGEAKARRSTRSVVLGKAKVMSYEDLEEARTKRAAKDEAAAGKIKSSRKRKGASSKSGATESNATEPQTEAARASKAPAPEPWRAPAARMVAGDWP